MIDKFKIFEQQFYKPQKKYPINNKCLNLMMVLEELDEKFNLETDFFWENVDIG